MIRPFKMRVFVCDLFLVVMLKTIMALGETTLPLEGPIPHPDCQRLQSLNEPIFLPYVNDCNKYYSCKNGVAYLLSCPHNLQWSIITKRCDYPEVAMCNVTSPSAAATVQPTIYPSLEPSTIYPASPIGPLKPSESPWYHSYPGDCNRFYQCEVMVCPPNFHWNAHLRRCDFPHIAACANGDYVPPTTAFPPTSIPMSTANIPTAATPPPTISPFTSSTPLNPSGTATESENLDKLCSAAGATYLHYPNDCHKFIQCNGVAFVQTCPAGLLWNEELLTCDRYCK